MKRRILTLLLCLLGAGTLGGGAYLSWWMTPPPMPRSLEEGIALFSSPRYQRLSEPQRQRYVERLGELTEQVPREMRAEAFRKAFRDESLRPAARDALTSMLMDRGRQFVKGDQATRDRLVNEALIAGRLMRGMRRRGPRTRAPGADSAADSPGDPEARRARRQEQMERGKQWIQERIERGNPQQQAYFMEYVRAIRKRREQEKQ